MQGVSMGRYRKIDTRTWNDLKFNELSDYGKLVFFLLLTHPHLTSIGAMRASLTSLSSDLKWSMDKFENAFQESLLNKMVRHDETGNLIWLPNFLKYNQPESPNVIRSWNQALDYLPECPLKQILIKHIEFYVRSLPKTFREALPPAFRSTFVNQEQEQEQEQEQKEKQKSGKPDTPSLKAFLSKDRQATSINQEILKSQALEILHFLNEKTGRAYRPADANINLIIARLKSGATLVQCRQIIAMKYREWRNHPKFGKLVRPATLFDEENFEQYIGELVLPKDENNGHDKK
jgi:uncharacterized phage protein (TIGR02220 family)